MSLRSVIPVWVVAAVGAAAVAFVAPLSALSWFPVVMALCILVTFAVQIMLSRKEGLIERIVASLAGALVILTVATAVMWFVTR